MHHTLNQRRLSCHTVWPLNELIDVFSTHKATDPRDKVYALLGLSSDNPRGAGLLPNCKIRLEKLFQPLVHFLHSEKVIMDTYNDRKCP